MTTGTTTALRVAGLRKRFGRTVALDDVDLEVRAGEIRGLCGVNGSGKSTLLRVLAGVERGDAGTVEVAGQRTPVGRLSWQRAATLGLRFVHQVPASFPDLSVAENVALCAGYRTTTTRRIRWRQVRRRAADLLDRLGVPVDPEAQVVTLRPGERTMVAIAGVLADMEERDADRVLFLDEPTAALHHRESEQLFDVIRRYRAEGGTVVYVSHRLPEVLALVDRVSVLRDGRVVAESEAAQLDEGDLTGMMLGPEGARSVPGPEVGGPRARGPIVLEATELRGGALDGVSLSVRAGEILGLAGVLGSGAADVPKVLFGALAGAQGEVRVAGQRVRLRCPADAIAAGLAYVPEDRDLEATFPDLSIGENLAVVDYGRYRRRGRISAREITDSATRAIDRLGVAAAGPGAPLSTLSGGNQQKVVVARWLEQRPRVVLLSEPTAGVDVGARSQIHELVRRAAADGTAVVVASSDLQELLALCDRLVAISDGRVSGEAPTDALTLDEAAAWICA